MPVTHQADAPPLKKFRRNNILAEIFRAAGESREDGKVKELRDTIQQRLELSNTMLGRMLNNQSQPTLAQAYLIAQVLEVSVDTLCQPEE